MLKTLRKYCVTQKIVIIGIVLFITIGYTSVGYAFSYYFNSIDKMACCESDDDCPCCKAVKSEAPDCICSVKSIPTFPEADDEQDLFVNKIADLGSFILTSYSASETEFTYTPSKIEYFVVIKTFPPGVIYLEISNLRI